MSEDLSKRIESLLLAYRTRCWLDGDGNGTPLIYVFAPPSDLTNGLGKGEVSELADYLAGELGDTRTNAALDAWSAALDAFKDAFTDSADWDAEHGGAWIINDSTYQWACGAMDAAYNAALASLTPTEPTP